MTDAPKNFIAVLSREEKLEHRKQEATKALLAQFDELNAAWAEKEKELLSMHIPKEVVVEYKKVQIDSDQGTTSREVFCLAMAKHRGLWRLCHGSYVLAATDEKDEVKWRPIVDCPLEFRLEAAQHFDVLKTKAIEVAESSIAKVKAAVEKLRQSL